MTERIELVPVRPGEPLSSVRTGQTGQVFPPGSLPALARQALDQMPPAMTAGPPVRVRADALAETIENIGLALGSRLREYRRVDEEQAQRLRAMSVLQHLVCKPGVVAAVHLDSLQQQTAGFDSTPDPGAALRAQGLDAGQSALLLASQMAAGPVGVRRARLESALGAAMEEDGWTLQLFRHLEFGMADRRALAELHWLYQSAATQYRDLVGWFDGFRCLSDRQRKLRILIRSLAFELSADGPAMGEQLAAVIADLKRILLFFGLEDHCRRIADSLPDAGLDGDRIMTSVLTLLQTMWLDAAGLTELIERLIGDARLRYGYGRQLSGLLRLLPDACFLADDQRDMLLAACAGYLEWLADQDGQPEDGSP